MRHALAAAAVLVAMATFGTGLALADATLSAIDHPTLPGQKILLLSTPASERGMVSISHGGASYDCEIATVPCIVFRNTDLGAVNVAQLTADGSATAFGCMNYDFYNDFSGTQITDEIYCPPSGVAEIQFVGGNATNGNTLNLVSNYVSFNYPGILHRGTGGTSNDTFLDDSQFDGDGTAHTPSVFVGGEGIDHFSSKRGNDYLDAGPGNEGFIFAGEGNDVVLGGPGDDDLLDGEQGSDYVFGGTGNDNRVVGGPDDDLLLTGGPGNDRVFGGGGSDLLFGGDGDDELVGDDGNDVVGGTFGNDQLFGDGDNGVDAGGDNGLTGDGSDQLEGRDGADSYDGGGGDDGLGVGDSEERQVGEVLISGGPGGDVVDYSSPPVPLDLKLSLDGTQNDGVAGEENIGTDVEHIFGGTGSDVITGDGGPNVLVGNHRAFGCICAERIDGRGGQDTILGSGGDGTDRLIGGPGPDRIAGAPLSDEVILAEDGEKDSISCPDHRDDDEAHIDPIDTLVKGLENRCENLIYPPPTLGEILALLAKEANGAAKVIQALGILGILSNGGFNLKDFDALSPGTATILLTAPSGGASVSKAVPVAKGRRVFKAPGDAKVRVKLTRDGKKLLGGKDSVKVTLTMKFAPKKGKTGMKKKTVTLKRKGR